MQLYKKFAPIKCIERSLFDDFRCNFYKVVECMTRPLLIMRYAGGALHNVV